MKLAPSRISGIVLACCAALALAGCKKPPEQADKPRPRAVTVVRLEPRAIVGSISASGDLAPREEAAVAPEVSGYRVSRVLVDVGDYVRAGQTLVQLDPALLEAQIASAQAQSAQADDQAKRVAGLDDTGVLSQEQIAQRRYQADVARANLRQLQTQRRKMAVTAPVSGLILERNVRPGDLSAVTSTPWFRMARDGQVELAAQVSQDDLSRIRPGQRATVTLPNGAAAVGNVRIISPQIDPQTKLGVVRILLPVRSDIRSGGFGRAVFDDVASQTLALPESAIRYDANGASVMVIGNDNRVRRATVQTGQRGSGLVQILKGPPQGSRIVQNAAAFLLDGDQVQVTEAKTVVPAATPAANTAGAKR